MQCACISDVIAGKVTKVQSVISILSFSQKGEHSTTSERFSLVNRVLSFGNTYFINRCYIKKSDFVRLLQFQSNDTIMTMFDKKSKEKDKKPKVIYTKYSKH